jgi:hypothetical protein
LETPTGEDQNGRILLITYLVSNLSTQIVQQLSAAKNALDRFSSPDWISNKHESLVLEADHEYIRPAQYKNPVTQESSRMVVYGLELDQVPFWKILKEKIDSLPVRIFLLQVLLWHNIVLMVNNGA